MTLATIYFHQVHLLVSSLISWYNINNQCHSVHLCCLRRQLLWVSFNPSQGTSIISLIHGDDVFIIFIYDSYCVLFIPFKIHNYWIMIVIFWSNCFTMKTVLSMMESYKDHSLVAPFVAWISFLYLHIYIFILYYTRCIPWYFLYSFTQYSVAKSREGVVQGIPYERTVHTFIPYIPLNCLIEHPRSLIREIYGSLIFLLELLLHLSISPFGD